MRYNWNLWLQTSISRTPKGNAKAPRAITWTQACQTIRSALVEKTSAPTTVHNVSKGNQLKFPPHTFYPPAWNSLQICIGKTITEYTGGDGTEKTCGAEFFGLRPELLAWFRAHSPRLSKMGPRRFFFFCPATNDWKSIGVIYLATTHTKKKQNKKRQTFVLASVRPNHVKNLGQKSKNSAVHPEITIIVRCAKLHRWSTQLVVDVEKQRRTLIGPLAKPKKAAPVTGTTLRPTGPVSADSRQWTPSVRNWVTW